MLYKLDFEGHFEYLMQSAEAFKTLNIIFQPYIMFGTKINQHSFWPKKFKLWTLILDWEWITHFCPLCVGGFDDDSKLPVVAHIMIIFDDDDWPLLDFRVFILFFELQQCCKCNTTS